MNAIWERFFNTLWYSILQDLWHFAVPRSMALGACRARVVDRVGNVLFNFTRKLVLCGLGDVGIAGCVRHACGLWLEGYERSGSLSICYI